ncbi:MAG: hypothetical protein J6L81_03175 [Clostridia bacterium]|nr:hypothetical protein [Clostridia bacterium]
MKYISIDKLSDFEFHDAVFTLEIFANNCLKVKAEYLNIHKGTEQNSYETDMEIASAFITFEGFNLLSYEQGRAWKQDENGEFYTTDPLIIYRDDSAHCRFLEQIKSGLTIFDLGIKEGITCFIDAMSRDPFFTICFTFKSVRVEWDEYKKEAWYTSHK